MSLGLPQHRVAVHPYDPHWPNLYAEEAARLDSALGNRILATEHIGSTAVPGLESKPIIDIAIAIEDFEKGFELVPVMKDLGYKFRGEVGVPRRHLFILRSLENGDIRKDITALAEAHPCFADHR